MPNKRRARLDTYLTSCEHTRYFADNRFVATQVGRAVKDKADVEPEVVALVVPAQLRRETDYLALLYIADDKPSAQRTGRYDVLAHVVKVEQ